MALPTNIENLLHGKTIEWERLEFKTRWNPEDVLHTMCAFANDIHNWGGGYIIVGVTEKDSKPKLPPEGLQENQLDPIQKEIIKLGYKISPNYFPITEPYVLDGKIILVIWCPAGDNRPYEAPETLSKKNEKRVPYIRITSNTVKARNGNLRQLQELTARIPFDDRMNNQASLADLNLGLIREYLQEINSNLLEGSASMPFPDLCRAMLIAKGPDEDIRPLNVGLLFFSKNPEKFFDRAWIELVWHKDNSGKNFSEVYFKGPQHKQLREVLAFIKANIIAERVTKHSDVPESDRFFNYPFDAVEEALSNSVYHKSYEIGSPIEVQVFPDSITILSHPGPVPPVNARILASQRRIIAREYRNRRVGDFLKELKLTEGRGTGLPTIYGAMEENGSPAPSFETDELNYVLVTLPIHDRFQSHTSMRNIPNKVAGKQVSAGIFETLEDIIAYSNQGTARPINGATNQVNKEHSLEYQSVNKANNQVNQADNQVNQATEETIFQIRIIIEREVHKKVKEILENTTAWIKRKDLFEILALSNQSSTRKKYLDPLLKTHWLEMEFPDSPTHPAQRYRITPAGKRILNLLKSNL